MNKNMKTQEADSSITMNPITAAEWKNLLPGVKAVISKVWNKAAKQNSYMLDKEDLESEAFLVCSKCRKVYNGEKGASFKTYFMRALEHELADKLRCGNITMLSGTREMCKRMGRAARENQTRGQEKVTLELLKEMYPDEKEETLNKDLEFWKGRRFDLDATYGDDTHGDGRDGYNMVVDTECVSPRAAAFQRDWAVLMNALEPAERLILQALQGYGEEGRVCKRLGISRPTFRLRKKELLNRLRMNADWQLMCECFA